MISVTDMSFPDIDYQNGPVAPKPDDLSPCLDSNGKDYEIIKVSLGTASISMQ